MFKEVDWLMNEHPDPVRLDAAKAEVGPRTRIVQCICGWGDQHDPLKVIDDPRYDDAGLYGFARPDAESTLPPTESDNPAMSGNAKNIEIMRAAFRMKPRP